MNYISLGYHDVIRNNQDELSGFPRVGATRYKLDYDFFQKHLETIAETKIYPSLIYDSKNNSKDLLYVFLTFDDGGLSAYSYIADMLEKLGWRGHFFITTDYIDSPSFLNANQLQDLRKRGHIIGTHSHTHPERMSECSSEYLIGEWSKSIKILSDFLGEEISVASVPGGYYSKKVAKSASFTGIKVLFTSEPVRSAQYVDNCLVLGRFTVQNSTSPQTVADIVSLKTSSLFSA